MVVGLLGNKRSDSNRLTLVNPKSENDVRLQAKLGNQNPTGLPVGVVSSQIVGKVIFMINPTNEIFIYINAISVGFGATITFIMLNQNRNNISDVVEIQNHRRLDAMVSTGDNLASKLAEALVTQLMAFALAAAGFNEALKINQTVATKNVICGLLGLVPCIVLVGMLITIRFLDIEKEKKESLEREGLRV